MTTSKLIYLPQTEAAPPSVLAQFLPRLPHGAAKTWLNSTLAQPGGWVVDPFGASPQLAVEAARAGYRVLVISNNPITRFLLDLMANPPAEKDMQAALADLASAKRGDDRMEQHIRELYTTSCDHCGGEVDAQSFLWVSEPLIPYARIYACPHCQHAGEFPVTDEDLEKASQFTAGGQHRARAIQRVASRDDPNRQHVEEALDAHLPRAVYALVTMINKLDGIDLEGAEARYLQALLLAACDKGNNLWRLPSETSRPRQLTTPPRFVEKNLWLALEEAVHLWANGQPPVALTEWPEGPPESGGICLYSGSIKEMSRKVEQIPVEAVITAFPRPNQAFWTLSALWAGWLWGRETIGPFAQVLERRRYDWGWHTDALARTLARLSEILPPHTPFFGMVTESEAGFDAAVLAAADLAGFVLEGIALRVREGQTQMLWKLPDTRPTPSSEPIDWMVRKAIGETILARGEPTQYLHLQSAVCQALSAANLIQPLMHDQEDSSANARAGNTYNHIRQLMLETLDPAGPFFRYEGGKSSIEIGKWWWPEKGQGAAAPLADRVEIEIVKLLLERVALEWEVVDTVLCAKFSGLQTPDQRLIRSVLDSYTDVEENRLWRLRENDRASSRQADVAEIRQLLGQVGGQLGFNVKQDEIVVWEQALQGEDLYFYVAASALLSRILDQAKHAPEQGLIALPGGRAELMMHKLERDPRLRERMEKGWRLLKFRHVRRMAESESVSRENLASYLVLDPITIDEAQLPLL